MVFGFVKQSGGHVKLYSEVGQGTTVKLYLPRYFGQAAPEERPDSAPATPKARSAETILVVEDEPSVREFSAEALRELGYSVLEADGAAAALRLIATPARDRAAAHRRSHARREWAQARRRGA
jgi:hypothetical protein